jgi:hypothetical protein
MDSNIKKQLSAKVLTKRGSQHVSNTIPRFIKWLIVNCAINVAWGFVPRLYILRGEWIIGDYIK